MLIVKQAIVLNLSSQTSVQPRIYYISHSCLFHFTYYVKMQWTIAVAHVSLSIKCFFVCANARWDFQCLLMSCIDPLHLHTLQSPFGCRFLPTFETRLLVWLRFVALKTVPVVPNWFHFRKVTVFKIHLQRQFWGLQCITLHLSCVGLTGGDE